MHRNARKTWQNKKTIQTKNEVPQKKKLNVYKEELYTYTE